MAYLVADGNEMGKLFDKCDREQMTKLSKGLECVMREALAKPTKKAMKLIEDRDQFIPVFPLILGGDDLFALIPAPWALDFALQFCQEYEARMRNLLQELGFGEETPTVSAAVVICKDKHPHRLAHETGEQCLKEAKRLSKRLARKPRGAQEEQREGQREQFSVVNFEVILGGNLVPSDESEQPLRPTLRPYWVTDKVPEGWGLPIQHLLDARKKLEAVEMPRKRLIEFRGLYDQNNLPAKDDLKPWKADLEHLLARIDRNETQGEKMRAVLEQLGGDAEKGYWHQIKRWTEGVWYGHWLPDLLQVWDFAQALDQDKREEA